MLKTEWVLRAGYGFHASHIAAAIRGVAGLPGVSVEQPARLASALEWMEDGMDFADALHLAGSGHCSAFLTFDRKFARRAPKRGAIPVVRP
jgi:predicted nucleic-acid-binding protein